jgi:hypothetical protein
MRFYEFLVLAFLGTVIALLCILGADLDAIRRVLEDGS